MAAELELESSLPRLLLLVVVAVVLGTVSRLAVVESGSSSDRLFCKARRKRDGKSPVH